MVSAGEHFVLQRVNAGTNQLRNASRRRRIQDEQDDATVGAKGDWLGPEGLVDHGSGNREKSVREVDDDAAERRLRGNGVLIGVRADDECALRLARRLK